MTMYSLVLCLVSITGALCVKEDQMTNYENLYELGMEAYKEGNWKKCSTFFSNALKSYSFYTRNVIECRLSCKNTASSNSDVDSVKDLSLELFFHDMILNSDCLRRCKKRKFGHHPDLDVSHVIIKKFEDRYPYNYLQFCYFKQNQLKEAAAAAYTYFITHQAEDAIIGTLQYYRGLPELNTGDFVDLERKSYQKSYIKGLNAYNDGDWKTSIESFELALAEYYIEEEHCRAGCEKGFSHNGFPDFVNAIADHYVTVIVCQQKCLQKLSTFGMQKLDNFVADHYNYLQYAYYEEGKLDKAFEAIANYLLFRPQDHTMLDNKAYYIKTLRRKEEEFVPTPAVVKYVKMWRTIDNTLDFVRDHYTLPGTVIPQEQDEGEEKEVKKPESGMRARILESFTKLGITLTEDFELVEGLHKYAMDGLIREDQCQAIADLARTYNKDATSIQKISITEAVKLVQDDRDLEICLRLMLRASEMLNAFTFVYFNQSKMFIRDSQVVCRPTGEAWAKTLEQDCILQEDGTCLEKENAAEFMVVAFLTEISDGTAEFYFMDKDNEPRYRLSPRCGRAVGFSGTTLHGVDVTGNQERCAIVITLTTEEEQLNPALRNAKSLLQDLEKQHVTDMEKEDRDNILDQFYKQGVSIVKTADDLLGSERFAADGLSTEEECSMLIDLAKTAAVSGDGYYGDASPLSEGEIFEGLSVSNAEKLLDNDKGSVHAVQLLLDLSDHARLLVEKYLGLTRPLFFDYTHLVCRTAVEGHDPGSEELSHPVHSDNCMIQPDGSCLPDKLAYTQRHYSAIMYLNDGFEGGEFFFAHKNTSEQISLAPQCGRLVAFNASDYHGVKGVTKGQRCAIAMWYTHDPNFIEASRIHAQRHLDRMYRDGEERNGEGKNDGTVGGETMMDAIPPEPFSEDTEDHDEL